ncbi:MAG: hypothetical protein GTN81_14380 [Proteobacteria bacterium]|nr:hypothetical protein [Pseudomonadota bacterium]
MRKTGLSLFYLAGYLLVGGVGFLAFPQTVLTFFFSNGNYSNVMVRLVGILMLSLGILIVQLIRHKVEALYKTTLIVRTIILIALASFYFAYRDPLMIVLFVIVGIGFTLTLTSYLLDRTAAS